MRETPAIMIGLAGAAFLLGSFAPAAIEARSSNTPAMASKGDRLAQPQPARERATVSTIEVIGLSRATVVFKDRNGAVLFRADPLEGTTVVGKNVDLPVVTLQEQPAPPAVQQQPPARTHQGSNPPPSGQRKQRMVGCENAVSPLVRSDGVRGPGLCLT